MKYLIACLLGVVVGAAGALGAIYFNPLTQKRMAGNSAGDWVLRYALPGKDALALTHGEKLDLPSAPAGISPLWESAIDSTALLTVALTDDDGQAAALGTRVSVPSRDTEFLLRGVILDDYWLVSVPQRGSFFVHVENNFWPLIKENVVPVKFLGRDWSGTSVYQPTLGPGLAKLGTVYGATGEFASAIGTASESYRLNQLSSTGRIENLSVELRLDVPEAEVSTALSAEETE